MPSQSDVTIVVPCFNEASRLDVDEFARLAQSDGVRLLFVDDGSRDDTARVLAGLCERTHGRAAWFGLSRNQGKAEAVRQGMLRAIADGPPLVGFLDADLSTPVDEVLRLIAELRARPMVQVLLASRIRLLGNYVQRKPARHYFGRIFATAASLALDLPVYDTQCGAKLFRNTPNLAAAIREPFLSRWIFDVELLGRLLYGTKESPGLPVEAFMEVPLQTWCDVAGSKLRPRHAVAAAADLVRIASRVRRDGHK